MRGCQFSFFLGPSDQIAFENALRNSEDIAFLKSRPSSTRPEEVSSSRILEMGKEDLGLCIARRADLSAIEFCPIDGREIFYCDPTVAPVVEFSRCYVTDRFIRAGRLYRIDKYWGDHGKLVRKSEAFVRWGEQLFKAAKKSLTKVERGYFAGEEALKLRRAGVAFEDLDPTLAQDR